MKIIKEVDKNEFKEFLYHSMDLEDKNIYKEAREEERIGVFQMAAGTASLMIERIQPSGFDELNACNAFARPGTMDFVDSYLENREKKQSKYPEAAKEVLQETNQVILYQEQMLKIFQVIGGFTLEEADGVRSLTKKLGKLDKDPEDLKKWEKVLKKFKSGAEKQNISEREAQIVADDLIKMSSYSFNKAHSTCYTYIAVMTLYLSHYFRKYFYSAVLQYEVDRDKYLVERLNTVRNYNFKILPPDINKSDVIIKPGEDNEIIFGLSNIKNVGENAANKIVENQPFDNFFDYVIKTRCRQVTSATTKSLIKMGAFDNLINGERKKYLYAFGNFWENKGNTKVREKLEMKWKEALNASDNIPAISTNQDDLIEYEKEVMGFNFFTSPFTNKRMEVIEKLKEKKVAYKCFDEAGDVSKKIPVSIGDTRIIKDKNDNEMAFLEAEDCKGVKQSIPIFASYWKVIGQKILSSKGKVILINVFRDKNGKFLFGQRGFVNDTFRIIRMVKEMP